MYAGAEANAFLGPWYCGLEGIFLKRVTVPILPNIACAVRFEVLVLLAACVIGLRSYPYLPDTACVSGCQSLISIVFSSPASKGWTSMKLLSLRYFSNTIIQLQQCLNPSVFSSILL